MIKVELGCGGKKQNGYIGVDRYNLPGVDIVADLNYEFPFEDDTVDEILACHSLEHLDDLKHVFSEIYRVSKHGSIVRILAPYYFSTLNISNFYHKNVWTEDTPRMFDIYDTDMVDSAEWIMPHALSWGVGRSDNSEFDEIFQIVKEEFFYFPEYAHLSEELKRQARRSMLNVCDQVYFIFVVNKMNEPYSKNDLKDILNKAQMSEPILIRNIRERDRDNSYKTFKTIFDRIMGVETVIQDEREKYDGICGKIENEKNDLIKYIDEKIENEKNDLIKYIDEKIEQILDYERKTVDELKQSLEVQQSKLNNEFIEKALVLDANNRNVSQLIKKCNSQFYDGILLNENYRNRKYLYFSSNLEVKKYLEYPVPGGVSNIMICLFSVNRQPVFLELVKDGEIVKQVVEEVDGVEIVEIRNNRLAKNSCIRIRLLEEKEQSIVRVLLTKDCEKEMLAYALKTQFV